MRNKTYIGAIALSLLCMSACTNRQVPYTFLIPANYKGILRVVCDENCGITPRIENGRQILEFQKDGVLILKEEFFNGGMIEKDTNLNNDNEDETKSYLAEMKSEYYLVDSIGDKTKITQIVNTGERLQNQPSILPGTTTVAGYGYHNSEVKTKGIVYQDFYLYNLDNTDTKEAMSLQQIEEATKALVSACRMSK